MKEGKEDNANQIRKGNVKTSTKHERKGRRRGEGAGKTAETQVEEGGLMRNSGREE